MAHIFNDPIDIEPLPVEGTQIVSSTSSPPPHDITLKRPVQETDFDGSDDGMWNFIAVKRIRSLLQRGFHTSDNPNSEVPRGMWLVIVADLMVAIHQSIRTSHGLNPSPKAFRDLDQEELALFNLITKISNTFYQFFNDYKDNAELWDTCLRCLEQCRCPLTEATYESVAMTCGQSINAIHATVVNEKTREIHQRVHDWGENLFTTITNAFTDHIVAKTTDANTFLSMDDPRLANWLNITAHNLKEHARSKLLDEAVDKYVVPWASERMDAATGSILATDNDRICDLRADAERRANTDADKYYSDLLPTLREEALACAKADAYASFAEDQARFRAEADAELSSFKHSLRIETAERKAKAQEAADKSVLSLTWSSAKANKGKARHDPMGKRSRAPSVSGSCPPSPTSPSPSEWPPSDIPAPSTLEAQVVTLMEATPVDTTPKAAAFHASAEAMAPVITLFGECDRAKAECTHDTILASVAANTDKQLLAFSNSFSTQLVANLTKQMTAIVKPLAKCIAAIEGDYNCTEAEDATADARDRAWGRGKEIIPSSDPNDVEMNTHPYFQDIPSTREAEEANTTIPPFIERIFRQIHQIPDNLAITHCKVADDLVEMNRWFDFFFLPSLDYDVEINYSTDHLPSLIEENIVRDYKEWYETGEAVPTIAHTRTLRPPAPSTVKPSGSNAPAYAGAAGTGRANVKVTGKGVAKPNPPAPPRRPSAPPITTVKDPVSSWSMPEDFQEGDGFSPIALSKDHPVFEIENRVNLVENEIVAEVPASWITVPRKGKKVSFAAAVKATTPPPSQDKIPTITQVHPSPALDLTKADLETKTKEEVRRLFNLRFNTNISQWTKMTKDALIASYIAKSNAPPTPPAPPKPQAPKILTTTQYTIVRNPTTTGLHKVTQWSHDQALVVHTLQRVLCQHFSSASRPPVELIGGRWSSQFSSNFVLIFNGQPGNVNVMKCRQVFYDFFGADISIVPQVGYSRVLLRSVPVCRDSEGNLPLSEVIASELANNQLCYDLTMFSPPRWLRTTVPDDTAHSAVIITFLDEDGS